ncbi:phage tail assembly protein [Pseudovibrio ascidiaceicola]|uniref:phage tail assembly protein n=1 Tax=Pseudovibrio ascidiaceicola TaxID=285279 RepID=UPI003D3648CB
MTKQIVTLASPIIINDEQVTEITLTREPIGSEFGNYTPFEVSDGNIKALAYVMPKITSPHLSNKMIKEMTGRNLMALTVGFNRFFDGMDQDGLVQTVETTSNKKTTSTISQNQSDQKA